MGLLATHSKAVFSLVRVSIAVKPRALNYGKCAPETVKSCNAKKKREGTEVVLNNGHKMPTLGLGTWNSLPGEVTDAVKYAIDVGYRHIDCACIYENEEEVGAGIKLKVEKGCIKREDLFVTSKLWNTFHRPDLVRLACEESLGKLGLNYLDLYLMHWPMAYKEGPELLPMDSCPKIIYSYVDYVDTWKEMEKLVNAKLCKSIGISNFNKKQIQRILQIAKVKPVVNQIECHPYLNQEDLTKFCQSKEIVITAYSPLGSPSSPFTKPGSKVLLEDPVVKTLAEKINKTPAQVLIRYQLDRDNVTIPKSVTPSRIKSNFESYDFKLTDEEMDQLVSLNCNLRYVALEQVCSHPHYPFNDED